MRDRGPSAIRRVLSAAAVIAATVVAGQVLAATPAAHASLGEVDFRLYVYPNATTYGQAVTLNAIAADDSTSCDFLDCNTPQGVVRFYDGGQFIGEVALHPGALVYTGEATLTVTTLEPGSHYFVAYYTGNFDSNNSVQNDDYISVDTDVQVSKAPCSLELTVDRPTTTFQNTPPVFFADLHSGGHTGYIQFLGPNNALYSTIALTNGQSATYTMPYIPPGTTTLHAVYYGDGHYLRCDSNTATHTLVQGEVHYGEVFFPDVDPDFYTIDIGSNVTADVMSNDRTYNRPVTMSLVAAHSPAKGTATITDDRKILYTPNADFTSGTDTFDYRLAIADGSNSDGNSNDATVTITVKCLAKGQPDSYIVSHDQPLTTTAPGVEFNDKTCGGTASIASQPTHGAVQFASDGSFTYTPAVGYEGPDSFNYTLSEDPTHAAVKVQLIVGGAVCVPQLVQDDFAAPAGGAAVPAPGVVANDTMCGNVVELATMPQHGTVELGKSGGFTYIAEPGYSGADSFTYGVAGNAPPEVMVERTAVRGDVPVATVNLVVTADPNATTTTSTSATTTTTSTTASTTATTSTTNVPSAETTTTAATTTTEPPAATTLPSTPPTPVANEVAALPPPMTIELPETGATSFPVALFALAMVTAGGIAIMMTRRRRTT